MSRENYYLFVDETQNFTSDIPGTTDVLGSILSEARKYRMNLTLTHQYLGQLPERVKQSILGNVGTLICFRLGASDAAEIEKEFYPEFTSIDLQKLEKYHIYLKLLIDGVASRPFSAKTIPPIIPNRKEGGKESIIQVSRQRYGTNRAIIEDTIQRWLIKQYGIPRRERLTRGFL